MYFSNVSAIIATANRDKAKPFELIGDISAIKRLVLIFQQLAIFPIIIITDQNNQDIKDELAYLNTVFLVDKNVNSDMLDTLKIGLSFMQNTSNKIIFSPVNAPLYSSHTLYKLLKSDGKIVLPTHNNKKGHPVIISKDIVNSILEFNGQDGLREYLKQNSNIVSTVEISDKGIFHQIHQKNLMQEIRDKYNKEIHTKLKINLFGIDEIFDDETKLLLAMIYYTKSVKKAQALTNISLSKCWQKLNLLEKSVKFPILEKKHGGSFGGKTILTEQGFNLIKNHQKMQEDISIYLFDNYLPF